MCCTNATDNTDTNITNTDIYSTLKLLILYNLQLVYPYLRFTDHIRTQGQFSNRTNLTYQKVTKSPLPPPTTHTLISPPMRDVMEKTKPGLVDQIQNAADVVVGGQLTANCVWQF